MTKSETDFNPSAVFDAMASEFAQQLREGKSPDIAEFASRDQDLAARIERLFPVLEMMERNGRREDWSEADLLKAEQKFQKLGGEKWEAPKQLGDYRLIRQIGRGGMGVVYEAEQQSLGRRVAIKILPASAQFDERRTERFATEAKASAMLHHTNIVPVFGIGREDGLSFIVMQYIHGQPLSAVLRDVARVRDLSSKPLAKPDESTYSNRQIVHSMFGDPIRSQSSAKNVDSKSIELDTTEARTASLSAADALSGSDSGSLLHSSSSDSRNVKVRNYFRNVALVGVRVSEALDHAHSYGILHRDIKPSNLLLDEQCAVWVTDFGLAKQFDSPNITRTGEVVGTLRYMSPEQLDSNASSSSDIFGLGLTLYEMLTLQPAYPGNDRKRLLEKVSEANPAVPRSIDSRIPRDLETIVMKCIQSEPSKRYATAAAVGEDLNRFLNGQPILARRISPIEKAWKWCQRRPALAATFAALAASILLGAAGVGWQWNKTAEALADSKIATEKAEEHFAQARSAVVQITESISEEELLKTPDLIPVRRKLLRKALDYQVEFVAAHTGDFDIELELAQAYLNLAFTSRELAKHDEVKECLKESKSIVDSILARNLNKDQRSAAIRLLAEVSLLDGVVQTLDSPDGLDTIQQAKDILLDGRNEQELSNVELLSLASIHQRIAESYDHRNAARNFQLDDANDLAFEHFTKTHDLIKRARSNNAIVGSDSLSMLANSHRSLGMANRRMGREEEALKHYSAAVEQFRKLAESEPDNTSYSFGLAESLGSLAFFYGFALGEEDMGISMYGEAIKEYQKLSLAYPSVLKFTRAESRAFLNSGTLYEDEEFHEDEIRYKKAREMRTSAVKLMERALLFAPNDANMLSLYGKSLMGLGLNHVRTGDEINGQDYFLMAKEQHEKAVAQSPQIGAFKIRLGRTILNFADSKKEMGDYEDAYLAYLDSFAEGHKTDEIMYQAGRELLSLALEIKVNISNASEGELDVAESAIESARDIFKEFALPKQRTLDRIMSDHRFKEVVASDMGREFLEWFEGTTSRLANANQ